MRAMLARLPLAFALLFMLGTPAVQAQNAAAQREIEAASEAAFSAAQPGPADIKLGDQAVMKLPADMVFIPKAQAQRLMKAHGNGSDPTMMGMVLSQKDDEDWAVTVNFEKSGFIKEDDAKNWDTAELLKSLQEGTEQANEDRVKRGFPELMVAGWTEVPKYDTTTHRLVWSATAKQKNAPNDDPSVNYNTYALGRDGYISLDLITGQQQLAKDKQVALTLLDKIDYVDGKRYGDFNSSTDKVAEYGLAALVAGVAAKKLGLLAVIAAFLAKFGKLALLAAAGAGGTLFKFFRRKKSDAA